MPSHLREYLAYYKQCDAPGYAVLVTGEWGTGKTYQVKEALAEEERFYVSLFGLQSADAVHSEVLASMDPTLAKTRDVADGLGDAANNMGGLLALGGLIPRVVKAILRREVKTERTLVFDDLERSGLSLKDTLGVINAYVEHHGCRVVVIAHDGKLADEFRHTKEKLFGQTIKVKPQIAASFDAFSSIHTIEGKRELLNKHRADIIGIFEASGARSLRVMKHLIEDLARLFETLDEQHLSNDEAMTELVRLFSALNIEVRDGQLLEDDLKDRGKFRYGLRQTKNDAETNKPPIIIADEKYPSIDLCSSLLKDQAIIEMLIEGRYIQELVRDSLDNSSYFLEPQDAPPWKIVINFDELEDDVVQQAKARMQEQFENREVTDSGEMLHIFSLQLMMSDEKILDDDLSNVVVACESYVDDLLAAGRLPPREIEYGWTGPFEGAYDGYVYWVTDNTREHFKKVQSHLIDSRKKAHEEQFPSRTRDLLEFIRTDGQAFFEQVCQTHQGDNPYALIPILLHIPPQEFVGAWMDSPKKNWKSISDALRERYSANRLAHELASEAEWVQKVVELLKVEAEKAESFQALRINRAIPAISRSLLEE